MQTIGSETRKGIEETDAGEDSDEYEARPDPSEPWRYACPECGSVQLRHLPTPTTKDRRFECAGCCVLTPREELIDRRAKGEASTA